MRSLKPGAMKKLFGTPIRSEFALDTGNDLVFCNHGSYGATPKRVLQKRIDLLNECESFPDKWFRYEARQKYDAARTRVANFLGSKPQNVVFVENPTTGISAIMNSIKFGPEDTILMYSHTYNAVKNIVQYTSKQWGAQIHSIELPALMTSEDQIVEMFVDACSKKNVKIAIIDHISSASAICFPMEKIVKALKAFNNTMVLVDGAHAPGQIGDLNLDELNADFYTGTLHKWCYAAKGTAFLWVHPKHQNWVRPLVTSHNYNKGYQEEFFKQGTGDYTRYLCVEEALDFYQDLGGHEAISQHAKEMLDFGEKLLVDSFHVAPAPFPQSMRAPYLRIVAMPTSESLPEVTFEVVEKLMVDLNENHGLVTALTFFDGKPWIRLSANVYNEKSDYLKLRDRLAKALNFKVYETSQ